LSCFHATVVSEFPFSLPCFRVTVANECTFSLFQPL
jgi:hypothetical protein